MKVTVNQYAKSLYAATKEKSPKEIDGLILNLVKILRKNRQLKLASKIREKFNELWNKENKVVEAEITTKYALQEKEMSVLKKFVQGKYQAEKVVLTNKINAEIKGGMIIKVGDEVLDGSILNQLNMLKNNLSK
jgi:F-type H+-transporting ATPase subunit delta